MLIIISITNPLILKHIFLLIFSTYEIKINEFNYFNNKLTQEREQIEKEISSTTPWQCW